MAHLRDSLPRLPPEIDFHLGSSWSSARNALCAIGFRETPFEKGSLFWHPEGVLCALEPNSHPRNPYARLHARIFAQVSMSHPFSCAESLTGSPQGPIRPDGDGSWRLLLSTCSVKRELSFRSILVGCLQVGELIPFEEWTGFPVPVFIETSLGQLQEDEDQGREPWSHCARRIPPAVLRALRSEPPEGPDHPFTRSQEALQNQSSGLSQYFSDCLRAARLDFAAPSDRTLFRTWGHILAGASFDPEEILASSSIGCNFFHLATFAHPPSSKERLLETVRALPKERLMKLLSQTDPRGATPGMACFEAQGRPSANEVFSCELFFLFADLFGSALPLQTPSLSALSLLFSKAHACKVEDARPICAEFDFPLRMATRCELLGIPWRDFLCSFEWETDAPSGMLGDPELLFDIPGERIGRFAAPPPFRCEKTILTEPGAILTTLRDHRLAKRHGALLALIEQETLLQALAPASAERPSALRLA